MSSDIVELAVETLTDWAAFEKISTEIMQLDGYPDIKPLGGYADGGQDACDEQFYSHEGRRTRVVFQFTLRDDVLTKIDQTVARLQAMTTAFHKLVIVTRAPLGSRVQAHIRKEVRTKYDIDLDLYERKTIVTRLADLSNGIFHRVFPDIDKQLKTLLESRRTSEASAASARERESF